ncbi:glycosyltransferase family 4 protein [Peribacillus muralis]|uniref:glycosyltransferase family 4 protein n=1 Tax=Peribacillus muralis TaxID=264697 RepID=UPI001F4DCD61|nr:glycosyltransferase family 4 protein [Peribacillus muralis]MCK1991637.1 glycosyltransferase family 4 protein [Peribacillus muralis]MCK2012196.1 glycosyltransferase family 4 protein [Peribacillus muralis]
MKVIMIGSHLRTTGGITRVVKNYFQAGLNEKVDLEYFPTYFGSNHIVNIFYFFTKFIELYIKLFILNKRYDVAHIHMSYKGSFIRKKHIITLLKNKKIPIMLHMHGSQFKEFYDQSADKKKLEISNTLNKVSIILALGTEWKEYYETICKTKVVSLDNAVFPKKIKSDDSNNKIYITTMGLLSNRKGTYDLLEVANKLKGAIDPKYKFLLAGDGEIEKVKKIIKSNNLEDFVIIPGWVSDEIEIEKIYKQSAIYVLPSYNEGMPMSILEAMSYGLPIISTNVGSIPTVVEKENGLLMDPGNINMLEENIKLLLNNKGDVEFYKKNNIEKIESKYNVWNSIEDIILIYKEVSNFKMN